MIYFIQYTNLYNKFIIKLIYIFKLLEKFTNLNNKY